MRLSELFERAEERDSSIEGNLSPLSTGHKKTIDIIGLGSLLGRNFLELGPHAHTAKRELRRVGMYRPELETELNRLVRRKGPEGSCKNEILDWIETNEPETYTELQIRQLNIDPKTRKPRSQGRISRYNFDGRLSPIT